MARRAITILIFINVGGLFAFTAMGFNASWLAPMDSNQRVTELDRAQVFNAAKLEAFTAEIAKVNPALAARLGTNVRGNLAGWIAERERSASLFNAVSGLLVCAVNLAAILIGRICANRKQRHGEQDQSPPAARLVG